MATVTAGIFKPVRRVGRNPEIVLEPMTVPEDVRTSQQVEVRRCSAHEDAPLAQADVVVAGGYGVGSAEGWRLVERLADVLDGVVGATRPPVDEGWTTKDRMIGASGKVISPRLYVALGISGMMHHTVGVARCAHHRGHQQRSEGAHLRHGRLRPGGERARGGACPGVAPGLGHGPGAAHPPPPTSPAPGRSTVPVSRPCAPTCTRTAA